MLTFPLCFLWFGLALASQNPEALYSQIFRQFQTSIATYQSIADIYLDVKYTIEEDRETRSRIDRRLEEFSTSRVRIDY